MFLCICSLSLSVCLLASSDFGLDSYLSFMDPSSLGRNEEGLAAGTVQDIHVRSHALTNRASFANTLAMWEVCFGVVRFRFFFFFVSSYRFLTLPLHCRASRIASTTTMWCLPSTPISTQHHCCIPCRRSRCWHPLLRGTHHLAFLHLFVFLFFFF